MSDCFGPSPSSHQSQAPWCPESPPPSPRASLLFCLSLNPRRGGSPLGHAHPLPLNPRPSPHLLCSLFPSPTVGILALGPLSTSLAFITLSLVPQPQSTLTISILYPKSLFMPLGQQAFPTGSLLPGPHPLLAGCLNPLWRCDLTPSNPSHHVGASQCAPWLSLLLPLRYFNSP